jgi:hypothetical protein
MVSSTSEIRTSILKARNSRSLLIKASVAWDHPCCPIHLNNINHMHESTLIPIEFYPS